MNPFQHPAPMRVATRRYSCANSVVEGLLTHVQHDASSRVGCDVLLGTHVVGWVTHAMADTAREALAAVGVQHTRADVVELPLTDAASTNQMFAQLAQWMYAQGKSGDWRNELLDVLSDDGIALARIERAAVRNFGFYTQATHLNLYTLIDAVPHLWLAQRSPHKSTAPNMWDTAVGGLVSAGETAMSALPREAFEEAGLVNLPNSCLQALPRLRMQRPVQEGWLREYAFGFDAWMHAQHTPHNQDGEVSQFVAHTVPQVLERIAHGDMMVESALITLCSLQMNDLIEPSAALQALYN